MVDLNELESAVLYVSYNGGSENEAYLNRETGQIFFDSPYTECEEDLPADVADKKKYVMVPSERDLDLGIPLRLDFIRKFAADSYEEASEISRRPKAYARLRELLETKGPIEKWYKFQQEALCNALRQWCAYHELEISETSRR